MAHVLFAVYFPLMLAYVIGDNSNGVLFVFGTTSWLLITKELIQTKCFQTSSL